MGGITMNENLDLTKILYKCPTGAEFYNTVYGKVKFFWVDFTNKQPIVVSTYDDSIIYIAKDGKLISTRDGECALFPSKDQRDWSKFERFWDKPKVEKFDPKTLHPFDKVLSKYYIDREWTCGILSHPYCQSGFNGFIVNSNFVRYCIPYNEETKHLVGKTDDCPEYYKWWEEWK